MSEPELKKRSPAWRLLRLGTAFAVLVAYAYAAVTYYRECSIVTSETAAGAISTQSTCAPPSVTSATVLVLLLVVLGLLWPDIAEITVLGVTLKRRVAVAEQKATDAKEATAALSAAFQLQQLRIDSIVTATASSTATIHNNTYFGSNWSQDQSERLKQQADRISSLVRPEDGPTWEYTPAFDDRTLEELLVQVLRQFEALAEILGLSFGRGGRRFGGADPELRAARESFIADYEVALQTARSLRNAVAHARDVPREDLIEGLELISRLRRLASQWIERRGAGPGPWNGQ